eukprot:TRINITY_DN113552_c0_g1_i1.p1 TRINITY_DN113552_c0_g1~~TRINITY_DN113552_c0_g1_i1.p1  ORF type:complete len:473 (-),score=83.45 TRINITY_DN113552_c0_g1_i1:56-1474(-)
MRVLKDLRAWSLCAVAAAASAGREYVPGMWGRSVYRAREGQQLHGVGMVNEESVYLATRSGISGIHEGMLTPLLEVSDGEITAFHLCHHRSSIFYEVLAGEGGGLSIFEYSLVARTKNHVKDFQDIARATSLACLDKMLLRASPSSLLSISLQQDGASTVLREFGHDGGSYDAMVSLTVGYAPDVYTKAEVYTLVPRNRTVLRLRLSSDAVGRPTLQSSEVVLRGGDGADGAGGSLLEPSQVLWMRDRIVIGDGCSIREYRGGLLKTLFGSPAECAEDATQSAVEPMPWASRISRLTALAGASDGTATSAIAALTATGEVVSVAGTSGSLQKTCGAFAKQDSCTSHTGCGWAEGDVSGERLCFDCYDLRRWAKGKDECSLEGTTQAGTRYHLAGCGCLPPHDPEDDGGFEGIHHEGIWICLVILSLVAAAAGCLWLYRAHRRAVALRELYGADLMDNAEFHTFTDVEDASRS